LAALREGESADRDRTGESRMLRDREKVRKPLADLLEPTGTLALHAAKGSDSRKGLSQGSLPEEELLSGRLDRLPRQAFPGGMPRNERALAREGAYGGASLGRGHGRPV